MYEMEDRAGHGRFEEVQKELLTMQNKLLALEKSRGLLESRLKDETSARSQLVSQLFSLRKVIHESRFSSSCRFRMQIEEFLGRIELKF